MLISGMRVNRFQALWLLKCWAGCSNRRSGKISNLNCSTILLYIIIFYIATNKDLLCSTGNSAQCDMADWRKEVLWVGGMSMCQCTCMCIYIYICIAESLCCSLETIITFSTIICTPI